MTETSRRLAQCFALVFPGLSEPEVYSASVNSVASWDSTAAIMLANVIEEEFKVQIDYELLPEMVSFELILDYLTSKANGSS